MLATAAGSKTSCLVYSAYSLLSETVPFKNVFMHGNLKYGCGIPASFLLAPFAAVGSLSTFANHAQFSCFSPVVHVCCFSTALLQKPRFQLNSQYPGLLTVLSLHFGKMELWCLGGNNSLVVTALMSNINC